MADPTKYLPDYNFSDYQSLQPNKPLPGGRVDIELAGIANTIDETIEALKDVRRADGKIQNGAVTADSLDPGLIAGIAADVIADLGPEAEAAIQAALPQWRGAWATTTVYAVNDLARQAGSTYICLVAHTAGVFSTDLAALRWELFAQQGAAGAGTGDMVAANNLSDLTNMATARTNLGVAAASATLLKADNLSGLADPAAARANLGVTAFLVPSGFIGMWSGSVASIPAGWALCNGLSGTPDLRNRFVVGAGDTYAVAATGGQTAITTVPAHTHAAGTLAAASNGSHTHTGTAASAGAHTHTVPTRDSAGVTGDVVDYELGPSNGTVATSSNGAHTHTLTINSGGAHTHTISGSTASAGAASVDVRPPYYALAYIMKL